MQPEDPDPTLRAVDRIVVVLFIVAAVIIAAFAGSWL
jgi:hypothetical protein